MTILNHAWNGVKLSEMFSAKDVSGNYNGIVCLALVGAAAVFSIAGIVFKLARKKSQDR